MVAEEFAQFRLDTVNQCLWRRRDAGDDERIALTPKAFGVLQYLVEHAGRLVRQDELLALWPQSYVQPEVLKHHVLEVRKALADDPRSPRFIETLPRRGYRFIAPMNAGRGPDRISAAKPAQGRLVGRDDELAALRDCLSRASRGERQVAFVTGEPGIGKSALVDEFQRQAVATLPGLRVGLGQCVEGFGSKESYYPMLEALGQLCRGREGNEIVDILAAQAPTWLVQFPALLKREHRETLQREIMGATRERMLREIGHALETITAQWPLLLIIEDLQWVDYSSVDLLSALTRGRVPARLMLVATKRPVNVLVSNHPLKMLKQDLLVHRLCREIALGPLEVADIAEYLTGGTADADPLKGLAGLIHRHSEGNPLFMVAAVEHLTRRGLISQANGAWQSMVPLETIGLEIPETLRQMIEAQIERLSLEEQQALEVASVAGAVFSPNVCAEAVDAHLDDFENLYESLVRRHRLVRELDAEEPQEAADFRRYEFVHALYREVLYQRQPPGRLRKLHRAIGERLEAAYDKRQDAISVELAHHFERGSDWTRAVKYLRLAAAMTEQRCGHGEAIGLLKRALELTSKLSEVDRAKSEIEILETLAAIYYFSADKRAPDMYETLASRAAQCGAIDVELRAVTEMAHLWTLVDSQRSLELFDRVVRLSAQLADPLVHAQSRLLSAYWGILTGGWNDEVAAAGRAAFAEIRQEVDLCALGPHLVWHGGLRMLGSEYRKSRRDVLEGLAIMTGGSKENPCANLPQANAVFTLFSDSLFLGEWGQALREIDAGIAAMARNANDAFAHGWCIYRSQVSVLAMDFAGALSNCESAVRALGDAMPHPGRRMYLAMVGTAEAALGQHERALEYLTLCLAEMDRQMVCVDWWCRLYVESALTELWIDKGDLDRARAQGERFLQLALATAERTFQSWAWEASARVAMAQGDHERARECVARALATMEGFELPVAEWRVHATAAALESMISNGESARQHLEMSRATIVKIADSLGPQEPLRGTFLSAPRIAELLSGDLQSQKCKPTPRVRGRATNLIEPK